MEEWCVVRGWVGVTEGGGGTVSKCMTFNEQRWRVLISETELELSFLLQNILPVRHHLPPLQSLQSVPSYLRKEVQIRPNPRRHVTPKPRTPTYSISLLKHSELLSGSTKSSSPLSTPTLVPTLWGSWSLVPVPGTWDLFLRPQEPPTTDVVRKKRVVGTLLDYPASLRLHFHLLSNATYYPSRQHHTPV